MMNFLNLNFSSDFLDIYMFAPQQNYRKFVDFYKIFEALSNGGIIITFVFGYLGGVEGVLYLG